MLEVRITAAPELVQAINNLAAAIAGVKPLVSAAANPAPAPAETVPPTGAPAAPVTTAPSAYPSNLPAAQDAAYSAPAPQPQPQAAGVPLAPPPQYTIDQIMAAGATLMDAGRVDDLMNLLRSFGVQAVTDLKPEQMGAFATALRSLGARI